MKNTQTSLIVKLEGESTISVNTLVVVLKNYKTITEQISLIASGGNYDAEIKVNAFNKGSFQIDFTIVTRIIDNIFSTNTIEYVGKLSNTILQMFSLYTLLKGKKANSEEIRQVIFDNPTIITGNPNLIVNIYQNQMVREGIKEVIQSAKEDKSVKGVTLTADNCNTIQITEEEINELATEQREEDKDERVTIERNALLTIVSLSFNKGDIWKFSYHNTKIAIKLTNEDLYNKIESGMAFKKGDALKVELEVTSKWNDTYNAYIDSKYKILNIIETIPAPVQGKLF